MDITHEQLDRYLCKIFTGIDVLYIKDGSEDICIEFRQPDNTIKLRANLVYDKARDKAIDEGMLATEDLKKLKQTLRAKNLKYMAIKLGQEGVSMY